MGQRKQNRQRYSFFWGVCLLLAISAAMSVHANASSIKETRQMKDTTLVIKDRVPIRSDAPLFIVNGMELPLEIFEALNTDYIESLEVLKDASATAIYGTRGINGVIIVTLKSKEKIREEKATKQIDNLLNSRGVDKRNVRYYIDGKEVPARTAYQTDIEQMEVKTGADGILEVYIKPVIYIRGEYE